MSTARDEAITKVDDPRFQGALARLILHGDPGPTIGSLHGLVGHAARGPLRVTR
jgi:hypothetical protein